MYRVRILDAATRELAQLDKLLARRIIERITWLATNLDAVNPEALTGELAGFYKPRVGDYRVIYEILHAGQTLVIYAMAVAERSVAVKKGVGSTGLYHFPLVLPLLEQAVGLCKNAEFSFYFQVGLESWARRQRCAGAHAGNGASHGSATSMRCGAPSSLPRRDAGSGWASGGGASLTGHTLGLAREHEERGNEIYALHLLGGTVAQTSAVRAS